MGVRFLFGLWDSEAQSLTASIKIAAAIKRNSLEDHSKNLRFIMAAGWMGSSRQTGKSEVLQNFAFADSYAYQNARNQI